MFGKLIEYDQQRLFTSVQKQIKYIEQNRICVGLDENGCKYHGIKPLPITEMEGDHIVEHTNGGKTNIDNLQMLCIECHGEKTKQFNTNEVVGDIQ